MQTKTARDAVLCKKQGNYMQDIIVYIIVGCITIYFLYKLYRNFIIIKKGDTMCQHCTQKCELRLLMEKKQAECLKNGGCGKKSCCH